jgi:hypothetical protein
MAFGLIPSFVLFISSDLVLRPLLNWTNDTPYPIFLFSSWAQYVVPTQCRVRLNYFATADFEIVYQHILSGCGFLFVCMQINEFESLHFTSLEINWFALNRVNNSRHDEKLLDGIWICVCKLIFLSKQAQPVDTLAMPPLFPNMLLHPY